MTNGINGINGCFIPPSAQGRAKPPCVGADSISARKVRVIAGASALGAPYTQLYVGRRGEQCSPVAICGGVKFYGSIWNAPLRLPKRQRPSPCVGADSISARKVRVIAGASALGAPYTQLYVGCRGEQCSPVAICGGVKFYGSI